MTTVNFGIIGMGPRGRQGWIRTLQLVDQARIVAVADRVEALRNDGAARAGISPGNAHAEAADLLARSDVDAVVIAVAPEHQPDLAVQALEAGKHVICEVPLAYSLEDCWRVVLAVERSGRKLSFGSQRNYSPFVSAWRELSAEGLLGKIVYGECQYLHGLTLQRYWKDSETGRPLSWEEARTHPNACKTRLWTMEHPITYSTPGLGPILQVLDDRVVRVTCLSTRRPSYYLDEVPNPDLEVALMETAGGAILRVAAGFIAPTAEPYHWWHVLGTKGEVESGRRLSEAGAYQGGLLWLADHYMRSRIEVDWTFTPHQPGLQPAASSGHGGLDYYPAHELIQSILHDRHPAVDVYRAAEIDGPCTVAAQSAAQRGTPLPVPDFRPGPQRKTGQAPA